MKQSREIYLIKSTPIWLNDTISFAKLCQQYNLQVRNKGLNYQGFYGFYPFIFSSTFVAELFKQFDKSRNQVVKITINETDIFQGVPEKIRTLQYILTHKQGQQLTLVTYELKDDSP